MLDINKILDITPLLFVVNLSILTNFIGDTMSFKAQELFKNNMILKHLIIILLIYSTISVLYEELSPFERIKKTIVIWIMYLLLVKNTLRVAGILVILMFLQFILEDYIKYLKRNNKKENIDKLNKLNRLFEYLILILLVVGHVLYINKQKIQFKSNFNYYDLYLGKKYT